MVNYFMRRLVISHCSAFFYLRRSHFLSFNCHLVTLPPRIKQFLVQTAHMTEDKAEEMTELYREQNGLDKPVYDQFFTWIKGIVTEGKFGYSFAYRKDAGEIILDRLPKTLMLAIWPMPFLV